MEVQTPHILPFVYFRTERHEVDVDPIVSMLPGRTKSALEIEASDEVDPSLKSVLGRHVIGTQAECESAVPSFDLHEPALLEETGVQVRRVVHSRAAKSNLAPFVLILFSICKR